jgi:hypothetical protein
VTERFERWWRQEFFGVLRFAQDDSRNEQRQEQKQATATAETTATAEATATAETMAIAETTATVEMTATAEATIRERDGNNSDTTVKEMAVVGMRM